MKGRRTTRVVLALALLAGSLVRSAPAGAWADWTQVQHNIRGHVAPFFQDEPGHALYLINWVKAVDPIAASGNEVCKQQADFIWNELKDSYHIWFVEAHPNACAGQPFGNILLVAKNSNFSVYRDNTHHAYTQAAYSTGYTKVFRTQQDGPERKRADCARISGTSAGFAFKVCTVHTAANPTVSSAQNRALRDNSQMLTPTMFIGDFNKMEDWMYLEVGSWQRDDPNSNPQNTNIAGKIDWVLGRNGNHFAIRQVSDPKGLGTGAYYYSDHELLVAFMKAQYN